MRGSRRLDGVPEYLSTRLMRTVAEARARGVDVISLGIGDPDTPPPAELREELCAQARRDDIHGYPTNHGIAALREAVAEHYRSRFGVELDPATRDPAAARAPRKASRTSASRSSIPATSHSSPILATRSTTAGRRSRAARPSACRCARRTASCPISRRSTRPRAGGPALLICGYPNNPTGAVADLAFFERLAAWGAERGVPICHDNAYAELTYDGLVAPSFLAAPGAREAGIEIYSLSKSLSLPGWRIAFAVGNAELIGRLRTLKTNIDSGMWLALQHAAIRAVELIPSFTAGLRELYGRRRDVLCDGLEALGMDFVRPRGALYVWMRVPGGGGSVAFAERLLERGGRRGRARRGLRADERRLRAALADGPGGAPRARPSSASAARSEST